MYLRQEGRLFGQRILAAAQEGLENVLPHGRRAKSLHRFLEAKTLLRLSILKRERREKEKEETKNH
jgi:hypothetical protein